MTQALARPAEFFDDKYGMDTTSLQRVLGKTLGKQIDYADLYFQYEVSDAVSLEEGLVKQASKHVNQGVGVRAVAGRKQATRFPMRSPSPPWKSLPIRPGRLPAVARRQPAWPYTASRHLPPISTLCRLQARIFLCAQARSVATDRHLRAYDRRITKVQTSFSSVHKLVLVATSEGLVVGDVQPLMRLNVLCIAEDGTIARVGVLVVVDAWSTRFFWNMTSILSMRARQRAGRF